MSHHSSSVNGEGTSHKDPLSRILDELSSLKLWKEMVKINQDEREQIREEERHKTLKDKKSTIKSTSYTQRSTTYTKQQQ